MAKYNPDIFTLHCASCGKDLPGPKPGGLATGYARTQGGARICYPCASGCEKREMLDAPPGTRWFAYMSSDEKSVTGWTGNHLGYIWRLRRRRMYTPTGGRFDRYTFLMKNGADTWSGTGSGGGMYCRLRKLKP